MSRIVTSRSRPLDLGADKGAGGDCVSQTGDHNPAVDISNGIGITAKCLSLARAIADARHGWRMRQPGKRWV